MATYDPRTIAIGVLGKPHGVRGEIGLRLFNQEGVQEAVAAIGPGPIVLERGGRSVTRVVTATRPFGAGLLITLEGITSREEAATLTHYEVRVERAALPAPRPDEYFVSDVVGCQVFDQRGTRLGVVRETFWNGAHDIMIVRADADVDDAAAAPAAATSGAPGGAGAEHLIPLVPDYVRSVDAPGRTIRVEWHDV